MILILKRLVLAAWLITIGNQLFAQQDSVYLFGYFKDNGQDGLHLAYSHDGLAWKALKNDESVLAPELSADKLMRDPCIIRGADGMFHLVFTVSWKEKGIGYTSSKDLLNWSVQKAIPVMTHEQNARNAWAPEITYDPASKTYMIYWATTITGRYPESTESEDRFNHRMYYMTTRDFKEFSETKLLYDPGFNVIDASIVKQGKRFVMFLKDESLKPVAKNLKIAYSSKLTGPYGPASKPITGDYWAEGPTSLKIGKQWIVYFDKYQQGLYGAVSSTDLKTWKDISSQISLPDKIRHGSIFKVSITEFEHLKNNL